MSPEEQKRRVVKHVELSWGKGRLALAEQLQSRYFTYKSSFISQPVNSAGFGLIVREIRSAMEDLEVVVDECLSEGNRVVTSSTLFGTLTKPAFGHSPTGKILTVAVMSFWTLNPNGDIETACSTWKAPDNSWVWTARCRSPCHRSEADGGRPLLQRFLRRCSYSGITLGIVLCKACVRLLEEGCVLRNSGGAEPAAAPIFSHRLIAAFGL